MDANSQMPFLARMFLFLALLFIPAIALLVVSSESLGLCSGEAGGLACITVVPFFLALLVAILLSFLIKSRRSVKITALMLVSGIVLILLKVYLF